MKSEASRANYFYIIFHGNLAFSAIEEEQLTTVIDKCYFALLDLIENTKLPLALELSGYTLEKIVELRPQWISKFQYLHNKGLVELIGSGYAQIIGPLVPYEVNIQNQKMGLEIYQSILGITPNIAFVNEQTFSKSMVDIYFEVGYKAIAMEWNNAFSEHIEWKKEYSYLPAVVQGQNKKLPVLWTNSIIFQYFQRTAHNENTIDEYLQKIVKLIDAGNKCIPIYCSDLEIFNYRPGRFETEMSIQTDEWQKINDILTHLSDIGLFQLPSDIIQENLKQNVLLDLTTSASPIVVKKQPKYSLSRWAACGRGATYINRLCFICFQKIKHINNKKVWKKLLYFWGSDFRTHITEKKWQTAIHFLSNNSKIEHFSEKKIIEQDPESIQYHIDEQANKFIIQAKEYCFCFFKNKGLCLDYIRNGEQILPFGTVKHGELDDIIHGADFYTGTTIIESSKEGKISDLLPVEAIEIKQNGNSLLVSCHIKLADIGVIDKTWTINVIEKSIIFDANLRLKRSIRGCIRLGTLTFKARSIKERFWYECKNGGRELERFIINSDTNINHHLPVSLIQSSQNGLGVTDGQVNFGTDKYPYSCITIDQTKSYPFVMLQNNVNYNKMLTRIFFSMQELDDTLKQNDILTHVLSYKIKI